jgi:EAL domain-containing protein (putative c-di-GMP-specific phosphodiesterase class I)
VRWQNLRRGMVPPFEFVPFAEQTGRIHLITQWMLGEAMRLCARLRAEGTPLQVSVIFQRQTWRRRVLWRAW